MSRYSAAQNRRYDEGKAKRVLNKKLLGQRDDCGSCHKKLDGWITVHIKTEEEKKASLLIREDFVLSQKWCFDCWSKHPKMRSWKDRRGDEFAVLDLTQ